MSTGEMESDDFDPMNFLIRGCTSQDERHECGMPAGEGRASGHVQSTASVDIMHVAEDVGFQHSVSMSYTSSGLKALANMWYHASQSYNCGAKIGICIKSFALSPCQDSMPAIDDQGNFRIFTSG